MLTVFHWVLPLSSPSSFSRLTHSFIRNSQRLRMSFCEITFLCFCFFFWAIRPFVWTHFNQYYQFCWSHYPLSFPFFPPSISFLHIHSSAPHLSLSLSLLPFNRPTFVQNLSNCFLPSKLISPLVSSGFFHRRFRLVQVFVFLNRLSFICRCLCLLSYSLSRPPLDRLPSFHFLLKIFDQTWSVPDTTTTTADRLVPVSSTHVFFFSHRPHFHQPLREISSGVGWLFIEVVRPSTYQTTVRFFSEAISIFHTLCRWIERPSFSVSVDFCLSVFASESRNIVQVFIFLFTFPLPYLPPTLHPLFPPFFLVR